MTSFYCTTHTNMEYTITDINSLHRSVQLTIEKKNNTVKYFDIAIHRRDAELEYSIH